MLANGAGVIVAAISWFWALFLLQQLGEYVHHGYPFMFTMLLLTASVYPDVSRRGWTQSLRGAATVAAITGVWTGFATNMRTSHFPAYLALVILLFASSEFWHRRPAAASADGGCRCDVCGRILCFSVRGDHAAPSE